MKKSLIFLMMLVAATTVSAQDLVDRVSQAVGVELPSEYKAPVKAYVQGSKVLEDIGGEFTEQFIKEQMKANWSIDRQNQLLFIWDAIYEQVTKKNFYDGEDGNKQRLADFEEAMDNIEICGKKYKQDFKAYMEQRSAEARQQSAEARQQSAEARQQSAEARQHSAVLTHFMSTQLITFYNLYKNNPNTVREDELRKMKESSERFIHNCKEFNIDYQTLLPLEVQRFYDIKPTKQNTLTCEKAIVKILNITLDEIVKLYNICQQAPHAEREQIDIKYVIESCQKYNVDYKSKLTPEIRRYFRVE